MALKTNKKEKIIIDVGGMVLGRAASMAASALRAKSRPDFMPNRAPAFKVEIKNYDLIKISDKKMDQKIYKRYSGYPSGLKKIKLADVYKKNPKDVFLRAVKGMLPKNKLQKIILKNIIFA
ncbi:MAG: uL13 family ribosomal protein [Patescibacteria group bacterium]